MKDISLRDKVKYFAVFIVSFVVLASLVVYQNYRVSGEMHFRTQAGANLFMGNDPAFRGTNLYVKIGREWDEFISGPQRFYRREVSEAESNRYFFDKTRAVIRQDPLAWARLISGKVFSLWTGREFLRTEDVYAYDFYFSRTPYALVSTRLVFLLALAGIFFALYRRLRLGLLYILVIAVFFPFVFFPIKTRYLMAAMPFVLMFSAYAVYWLYDMFRNKRYAALTAGLAAIFLLNLAANYNPLNLTIPDVSEALHAIGVNYRARGDIAKAVRYFEAAVKVDPQNVTVYNDLGLVYMAQGDCRRALAFFRQAMEIAPEALYPRLNYDLCEEKLKQAQSENLPGQE